MFYRFFDFMNEQYTLAQFSDFPQYKQYLLSVSKYSAGKLLKQGLTQDELDSVVRSCLTVEENFKNTEAGLREFARELGYNNKKNGLDISQHCHPLVIASYSGRIDFLKMAAPHDYAWHHHEQITYTMASATGNSLNQSERYDMLEIAASKGLYNILKHPYHGYYPWSGTPNNYKPEEPGVEREALKKLIITSLGQFTKEELLAKCPGITIFKEVYDNDPVFREAYDEKVMQLSETSQSNEIADTSAHSILAGSDSLASADEETESVTYPQAFKFMVTYEVSKATKSNVTVEENRGKNDQDKIIDERYCDIKSNTNIENLKGNDLQSNSSVGQSPTSISQPMVLQPDLPDTRAIQPVQQSSNQLSSSSNYPAELSSVSNHDDHNDIALAGKSYFAWCEVL